MLTIKITKVIYQCEFCGCNHDRPEAIETFGNHDVCTACSDQQEELKCKM